MSKDKREGWLADLQVGSKVIVVPSSIMRQESIQKVLKITPTGQLRVGDSLESVKFTLFDHNGWEKGVRGGGERLKQITLERYEEILKEKYFKAISYLLDNPNKKARDLNHTKTRINLLDLSELQNFYIYLKGWQKEVKRIENSEN